MNTFSCVLIVIFLAIIEIVKKVYIKKGKEAQRVADMQWICGEKQAICYIQIAAREFAKADSCNNQVEWLNTHFGINNGKELYNEMYAAIKNDLYAAYNTEEQKWFIFVIYYCLFSKLDLPRTEEGLLRIIFYSLHRGKCFLHIINDNIDEALKRIKTEPRYSFAGKTPEETYEYIREIVTGCHAIPQKYEIEEEDE